jgi:tetratricopeptide (TPR) repeat protein
MGIFLNMWILGHDPASPRTRALSVTGGWLATLLVASSLLAPPASAEGLAEAVRLFDEGNRFYLEGDYVAALSYYERAEATGFVSGALYFNTGSAHYRLDHVGQAIRYYERALRLMPRSAEVSHSLEVARGRTEDRLSQLPPPFWSEWWRLLVATLGARGLLMMGLALYLVGGGLVVHRAWSGDRRPWHRRTLAACLLAGILLAGAGLTASFQDAHRTRGVVLAREVSLHAAPDAAAPVEARVHEGLVFDVLRSQETWELIRLPNGVTGWVPSSATGSI